MSRRHLIGRPEGRPSAWVRPGRTLTYVLQDDRAAEAGLQPVRSPVAPARRTFFRTLLEARMMPAALHVNPVQTFPRRNEQRLFIGPAPEPHVRRLLRRRDVGQLLPRRREDVDAWALARNGAIDVAVPVHADP